MSNQDSKYDCKHYASLINKLGGYCPDNLLDMFKQAEWRWNGKIIPKEGDDKNEIQVVPSQRKEDEIPCRSMD